MSELTKQLANIRLTSLRFWLHWARILYLHPSNLTVCWPMAILKLNSHPRTNTPNSPGLSSGHRMVVWSAHQYHRCFLSLSFAPFFSSMILHVLLTIDILLHVTYCAILHHITCYICYATYAQFTHNLHTTCEDSWASHSETYRIDYVSLGFVENWLCLANNT